MRVPPHNIEAEESLLGAMMLNRDAIHAAVAARIEADDFYKPAHGLLFDAIRTLAGNGEPVDPVSVSEELRKVGRLDALGGKPAVMRIQAVTPASANATHFAKIVSELALLRGLIRVGGEIAELGYASPEDPRGTVDQAEALLFTLADRGMAKEPVRFAESIQAVLDRLDRLHDGATTGVPTGFKDLDDWLLGLQPAALYVLAARPAMGKSALALGIADHVASAGKPVVVFSLEMQHEDLTSRLLAGHARMNARRMWDGDLDTPTWERLNATISKHSEKPLWLDDDPAVTVLEIRAKARRLKARHGLGLLVVDYMQLMSNPGRNDNRQQEVDQIARGLKVLARELQIPVLALSQLNREVERRQDKRPTLADLRDSGAIEQHADVVMFIYRDEIYNPESDQRGTAEVIIAKHRNGPCRTARLAFFEEMVRFADMARQEM